MNINSSNDKTPFSSNIRFVTSKEFDRHCFHSFFYCGRPTLPIDSSMLKGKDIWTPDIRTCTAGGVVDSEGAAGFHIFDCRENLEKLKNDFIPAIKNMIQKPLSALIIGSKKLDRYPDSIPVFEETNSQIKKLTTPSVFKTHSNRFASTDIGYEQSTDTWFINSTYPKNPMMPDFREEVLSVDDLKNNFERIRIAPQDNLFIMDKPVTRGICPEFFE